MKKVAVVLSGCGVMDGSEINEAVLTLLAIEHAGASYQCFAPDYTQMHVINHLTGEVTQETRNVLVESARIARGNIKNLQEFNAADFDALIFPGGFGAAKNLCDFAIKGAECTILPEVEQAVKTMYAEKKPVGFLCIAPTMIPKLYPPKTKLTIGNDQSVTEKITAMGAEHLTCPVDKAVVDKTHKVVSTPAYMLAEKLSDAHKGIQSLVNEVLAMS